MEHNIEVTYIGHSGFLVSLPEISLLFDYYQGEIPEISKDKELFIFASHFHQDHYNKEILAYYASHEKSHFVVSRDIRIQKHMQNRYGEDVELDNRVFQLKPNTITEIATQSGTGHLQIETFKSTDIGLAYLVTYDGKRIYHGGDLNMWVWRGESKAYNNDMKKKYMTQMEILKGREIDVAFLPLDPRQEEDMDRGMEIFLAETCTKYAFPMHCWEQYDCIEQFKKKPEHQVYQTEIMSITQRGERFTLERR